MVIPLRHSPHQTLDSRRFLNTAGTFAQSLAAGPVNLGMFSTVMVKPCVHNHPKAKHHSHTPPRLHVTWLVLALRTLVLPFAWGHWRQPPKTKSSMCSIALTCVARAFQTRTQVLADQEIRALLDLFVDASYVLGQNANREQLDATEKHHAHHNGGVA